MTTIPTTPRASHAPTNLNPPRFSKSNGHHTLQSPIKISHLSQSFLHTHSPNPTFSVSFSFPSEFYFPFSPFSSCAKSLTMLLKAAVNANASLFNSENTRLVPLLQRGSKLDRISVSATKGSNNNRVLTGVLFEPFEEVKKELDLVPIVPQDSLARHKFHVDSESAINEQINVEYNVSYVYHAMYAYFDRDNVALKGLAKFFKESSEEERGHAEKLMEYQNIRGGKVKLQSIVMPLSEFDHADKGDALHAMELALSLEKLTNEKLLNLHNVASKNGDVQLADFVETEFLGEQVEAIKKISEYVAQLRRVGKGHGVWHFDQMLLNEAAAA